MTSEDRMRLRSYAQHIMDHGDSGPGLNALLNPEHVLELLNETESRDITIDRCLNALVGKLQGIVVDHISELAAHKMTDYFIHAFEDRVRREITTKLAERFQVDVAMDVTVKQP